MSQGEGFVDTGFLAIQRQTEAAVFLQRYGLFEHLLPINFPGLPEEFIATLRYNAMNVRVNDLMHMAYDTNDVMVKARAASRAAEIRVTRDQDIGLTLKSVTPEAIPLTQHVPRFLFSIDEFNSLQLAIERGLVEQVNPYNFPALSLISKDELQRIKFAAEENRKYIANRLNPNPTGYPTTQE